MGKTSAPRHQASTSRVLLRILVITGSERDAERWKKVMVQAGLGAEFRRAASVSAFRQALAEGEWDAAVAAYPLTGFDLRSAIGEWERRGRGRPFVLVSDVKAVDASALLEAGVQEVVDRNDLSRLPRALEHGLAEAVVLREQGHRAAALSRLARAVEQGPVSIMITDTAGNIEYVNRKFVQITGYEAEEVLGRNASILKSGYTPPDEYRQLWQTIRDGGEWRGEFRNCRKDGRYYWASVCIVPVRDAEGTITHFLSIEEDVSETHAAAQRVWLQANYDELTALPNRNLFMDRLGQALAKAARGSRMVGLMYLDLDRFKTVNDTLGHEAGDELLRQAARRLVYCVRESDTVSRLGGDEFTVVLPDLGNERAVVIVATKILEAISQPFVVAGREAYVSASIGITLYPSDGPDSQGLLRNADSAMYQAKEAGRNTYRFFTQEMNNQALERAEIENDLRRAVEDQRLSLAYQPIIQLDTGNIVCAEALLRWDRPGVGKIPAERFMSVAEETGLIQPIGEWALRTACAQMASWSHPRLGGLRLSVNLSALQCRSPTCTDVVRRALAESGLSGQRLTLEIKEGLFMGEDGGRADALQGLRDLGVRLSVDDFGTGYASLSYLKRFPVDTLKIDRSFVRRITRDPEDQALCRAIIALAHTLRLNVVAEGVEAAEQLDLLRAWECDLAQGRLLSPPLPPGDFEAFVRSA
jgi:diguanylate cyclase (GGDEF)-like protein/PAS domain S-box-containing protein